MKLVSEFKQFAIRGNAIDMAVGIVVGAGFTGIVNSFVKDIFMPPLGLITGKVNFTEKALVLEKASTSSEPAVSLHYGLFFSQLLNFIIIAFAVFILVKIINRWREAHRVKPDPAPTTKNCQYCFSTISIKASKCPECTADNP